MIRFILSSIILIFSCSSLASPLPQQPHIYVEGSATIEVEPDEMQFTLSISETAKELTEAKSIVDVKSNKLISLCKKLNIRTKDITTSTLRINPQFKYNNGKRTQTGTQVSREINITLRDLSNYADVIRAFIDADITQTVNTTLVLSDPTGASDKAQEKALSDANQRAKRLAKHQGKKLGSVYSISEFNNRRQEFSQLRVSRNIVGQLGNIPTLSIGEAKRSSVASEPFEPGVIKATAQVYVVYLLD